LKKYIIQTYGCQMNEHDSEKISYTLEGAGYTYTDHLEEADFILLNTCIVRENAEHKVLGQLGALKHLKQKKPDLIIAVSGCMMQTGKARDIIRDKYRHVDIIFGTKNIDDLPYILNEYFQTGEPVLAIEEEMDLGEDETHVIRGSKHKAYISIAYGCDNYCSYCIVPYARGREISREPGRIIEEARILAEEGYKEITLLGQNVNSYGKTLRYPIRFPELLEELNKIDGLSRIRFMTSHPKDLSDELIDAMGRLDHVCEHFHLPVQSGSDAILKRMNRKYTRDQYMELVRKLREAVPGIALSTDIIVGFPGETEADFLQTLDLVKQAEFDAGFTFIYSPRPGTPAARMEEQVPKEIVSDRFQRLVDEMYAIYLRKNRARIGTTMEVLVDGTSKTDTAVLTGRTRTHHLVHFPGEPTMIGQLVDVRITGATSFTLEGEQV
jgi:tRNA-2-methylthio-N6-dimethylallyladenosine synthase